MRHRLTALLSSIAAIALVASCATDDSATGDSADHSAGRSSDPASSEATSSPTSGSTATNSTPRRGATGNAKNTARQMGEASNRAHLVLVDVRSAHREGFDRIVMEFSGHGTPGWQVNYADKAVLDGSGKVVALKGSATLDIYASGTTWPSPDYYDGPSRLTPPHGGVVVDVFVGGTFEGFTQIFAGIDGDRAPFRVSTLTAPSRLVIDVVDEKADRHR